MGLQDLNRTHYSLSGTPQLPTPCVAIHREVRGASLDEVHMRTKMQDTYANNF